MKKLFTYRNAMIGECAGFALFAASLFVPAHSLADTLLYGIGTLLIWVGIAAWFHEQGYNKGRTEALKVEIKRVWVEQEPFSLTKDPINLEPYVAKTFREPSTFPKEAADWTPLTEQAWLGNRADDLHEPVEYYLSSDVTPSATDTPQPVSRAERKEQERTQLTFRGYDMLDEHHGADK